MTPSGDWVLNCLWMGIRFDLYYTPRKPLWFWSKPASYHKMNLENVLCFKVTRKVFYGQVSLKVKSKAVFIYRTCSYTEEKINCIKSLISLDRDERIALLIEIVKMRDNGTLDITNENISIMSMYPSLRETEPFCNIIKEINSYNIKSKRRSKT